VSRSDRAVWGLLLLALLGAGAAGLLLSLLLFPESRLCYDTLVAPGEGARCLWPDGGLPKALTLILLLPTLVLVLTLIDGALARLIRR